jgi:hypothetical protein
LVLSLHVGAWQRLPVHTPLAQSAATIQALVSAHFAVQVPPQSVSVSVPFFTLSEHDDWMQTFPVHTPLVQSAGTTQDFPFAHLAEQVPPQSTSPSVPFFTLSVQVAAMQRPFWQTREGQSPASTHSGRGASKDASALASTVVLASGAPASTDNDEVHAPDTHTCPFAHVTPHAPQLLGDDCKSAH